MRSVLNLNPFYRGKEVEQSFGSVSGNYLGDAKLDFFWKTRKIAIYVGFLANRAKTSRGLRYVNAGQYAFSGIHATSVKIDQQSKVFSIVSIVLIVTSPWEVACPVKQRTCIPRIDI